MRGLVVVILLSAFSACGGQSTPTSTGSTADSDSAFVRAWANDPDVRRLLDAVSDSMDAVVESTSDPADMAAAAGRTADAYAELTKLAVATGHSDSMLGQRTLQMLSTCADAYAETRDAIESLDADRVDAAADMITACNSEITDATAAWDAAAP